MTVEDWNEDLSLASNVVDKMDPQKDYSEWDTWVVVISGLPKYTEDDQLIEYTVEENDINYYTLLERLDDDYPYFELRNEHKNELTSVNVEKIWDDSDDADGLRPAEVTVHLFADGEDTGETLVLSEENEWKGEFADLLKFKDGKEIAYTVAEDAVEGYDEPVIEGSAADGFTITNTHTPDKPGPTPTPKPTPKPKPKPKPTPRKTVVPHTGDAGSGAAAALLCGAAILVLRKRAFEV